MMEILPFVLMGLLLVSEAFFSGSEIAIVAASRIKLRQRAELGHRGSKLVERMMEHPEQMLSTTLVGTNLSVVANTIIATMMLRGAYHERAELYALLIMVPMLLLFGEIIPKSVFQQKATVIAPKVIYGLWFASRLLYPVVWALTKISRTLLRLLGADSETDGPFVTRQELKIMLRNDEGTDTLEDTERKMLRRIIHFSEKKVDEIMIPLVDIAAIPEGSTITEAVEVINQKGFSRLPVYREKIYDIMGVLTSFDLLGAPVESESIGGLIREVPYVPETKRIDDLLVMLKNVGSNLAVVVDEYGGAVGIVTIEDVQEEVVGEIEDEYDRHRPMYRKVHEDCYVIKARMEIDHINEVLQLDLPAGEYETLGGFILDLLGRIPDKKDTVRYKNLAFTVIDTTPRAIREVRLEIQ